MKLFKILITLLFLESLTFNLQAADAQQVFEEANSAYTAGNYAIAIEKYEAILNQKVFSKELYYNLGNSYYKLNKIGKAVLYYEKALRIAPSDSDIKHNLYLTKSRIVEDIEPVSSIFLVRWWRSLRGSLSPDTWSSIALLFLWIGISGIGFWLLGQERLIKKRGFIVGATLIPLSIFPFLLANDAQSIANIDYMGVITVQESPYRTSPDANTPPVSVLHEGIKVQILDKIGQLIKVRLPNGEEGWLAENTVERI